VGWGVVGILMRKKWGWFLRGVVFSVQTVIETRASRNGSRKKSAPPPVEGVSLNSSSLQRRKGVSVAQKDPVKRTFLCRETPSFGEKGRALFWPGLDAA